MVDEDIVPTGIIIPIQQQKIGPLPTAKRKGKVCYISNKFTTFS